MKLISKIIFGAVIVALGAVGFAYSGLYNVSALTEHSGLTNWLLSTTSRKSIQRQAQNVEVPDLSDEKLILEGVNDYQAMCIACHGGPGTRPEAIGKGLNPQPTDLAEAAKYMTAAELFWVIKNGVKMTGMPAWGASHEDAEIWPVVAFLTTLPDMDSDQYQSLLKQADGMGHHVAGSDHSHQGTEHNSKAEAESDHDHQH